MTKSEFLDTLRQQLEGELTPAQIEGHLHYYREYIAQEVAAGKSESEVLEELGSPVMIATTLVNAARGSAESGREENLQGDDGYIHFGTEDGEDSYYEGQMHTWHVNPTVLKWGIVLALICFLLLAMTLVGTVMMLVARFFVPILVIVVVLYLFRRH